MRIIAGTAKGRRLFSPGAKGKKGEIRPTSDRAREALFNVLASEVKGAQVLDLFAGTGALGLEALSRGAESALFVDKGRSSMDLLHRNVETCGFLDKSTILKRDLTRGLFFLQAHAPPAGFSLVFIDPPYKKKLAESIVRDLGGNNVTSGSCKLVVEFGAKEELPPEIGPFSLFDRRSYGEAGVWFFERRSSV